MEYTQTHIVLILLAVMLAVGFVGAFVWILRSKLLKSRSNIKFRVVEDVRKPMP
jgi:hypothetical protein